jgi:hypothetical protein
MSTMVRNSTWRSAMGMAAAAVLATCGVATFAPAYAQQPADKPAEKQDASKVDQSKMEKRDSIIFRNGNKVEGVILDENDASVKFLLIVSTLRSEVTYSKADILDIRHNEFAPAAKDEKDSKKDDAKPDVAATTPEDGHLVDVYGKPIEPGTMKVYLVTLGGEFGRDVSRTPVKAMMDDIARVQPDILLVRFDHSFGIYGQEAPDFAQIGRQSYNLLETARELDTLISDRIASDPTFKVKPRQIAWIKKALGPAAFLPFVFPEIYFTSDGHHGGIGGLDLLFKGQADDVVAEKQISLRLGRSVGLAEKGGHDGRIMKAMSRGDYVLSYRIVGGQVEWLDNQLPTDPSWFILKDDGSTNDEHKDSMQDLVRLKGNDYLTLDAKTAFDIGMSKGTADTVDELMNKLNISRGYAIVKNKSDQIFKEWSVDVSKAEKDLERLYRKYQAVEVRAPGQYEQRTAARGQRKGILREMQGIIKVYAESLNPRRFGAPDDFLSQLNLIIDQIDTAQRMDRRP